MRFTVIFCCKSSASSRALHSIILSFRVLQMKASIEMCNKGTSCQLLTYARQHLLSFSWIFLLLRFFLIRDLKCLFPIKMNQSSSQQHEVPVFSTVHSNAVIEKVLFVIVCYAFLRWIFHYYTCMSLYYTKYLFKSILAVQVMRYDY